MSRAAIYARITNDPTLNGMGIHSENVFPNYTLDGRPRDVPFLILRWEESTNFSQSYTGMRNGINRAPRMLTIWAHQPKEMGDDFTRIDQILDAIDAAILPMEHVEGVDGHTVTCVRNSGRSRDLIDQGYNTITRHAAYAVLSRPTE